MESVAYFPKFFQIYTHPHPPQKKTNQFCLFFHFFLLQYLSDRLSPKRPPKKIVTTLQKFTPKQKKPPPVDICSFTSIFCKKPGVKEKHPSGVHTNSSEEEIWQSVGMNFILPKTHSNSRSRYVSWRDREGTAIFWALTRGKHPSARWHFKYYYYYFLFLSSFPVVVWRWSSTQARISSISSFKNLDNFFPSVIKIPISIRTCLLFLFYRSLEEAKRGFNSFICFSNLN